MHEEVQNRIENMIEVAFDRPALKRVCEAHEDGFEKAYGLTKVEVAQREPMNFYYYQDNGSDILAVAHLDTVVDHKDRLCNFIETAGGPVVYSGALDDRLGAYIILELLPALGIRHDILLTVGEESGMSTAQFFEPSDHHDRDYNWVIEFDRGGSDVVLYEYEDEEMVGLVRDCGARVGVGAFSDISYMEHLGIKAFNWGVGYQDYHSVRGHAHLDDTVEMVAHYLRFYAANGGIRFEHEERSRWWGVRSRTYSDTRCDNCWQDAVDPDTDWCTECGICNTCWVDALNEECECRWAVADRAEREAEEADEQIAYLMGYGRDVEDVRVRDGVL